jgi:GT2 family glycosyltransferase/LmbE family N-acetylglucosaminyl deacetylase
MPAGATVAEFANTRSATGTSAGTERGLDIAVVIVTYRSAPLTIANLRSLLAEGSDPPLRIRAIVVDNASGDLPEISRAVNEEQWQSWVTLVAAPRNGGFAYGCNIGINVACATITPSYVCLLNPDTQVRPGAIKTLAQFLETHPEAGIAGPSFETGEGHDWQIAFRFPTLLGELEQGLELSLASQLLQRWCVVRQMGPRREAVDWVSGAAMMIRPEVFAAIGGLDENYFLFFEETDLCRRARQAGFTTWYVPESRVMHIGGCSTSVTPGTHARLPSYWFESRRRYFAVTYGISRAMMIDVVAATARTLGAAKRAIQGRSHNTVPSFVRDLLHHSVLWRRNRNIAPLRYSESLSAGHREPVEASFSGARRRVLVIEPHADDAVLSVGGTMWLRRHECTFVIATMASRSNHTRFRDLGRGRGPDIAATTELRRRESELAARMLGGEHVSVGMTDTALRYHDGEWSKEFYLRHRVAIQASTARVADDAERAGWIAAMRQLLEKESATEVWIPLGGPHADHMLTVDACFAAIAAQPSLGHGRVLRVYQEFPYGGRYPRRMRAALAALTEAGVVLEEERIAIASVRESKRRLASVYDSQNVDEMYAVPGIDETEWLWTVRELPRRIDASGLLSQALSRPPDANAITDWLARNRDSPRLRVLLLAPTGHWARDLQLLGTVFPRARFEVYVAAPAAAEVADVPSERVDMRTVAGGTLAWVLESLRLCIARPAPTLFHAGERRERQARLLSRFWLATDALVISTMDHLASALRTARGDG